MPTEAEIDAGEQAVFDDAVSGIKKAEDDMGAVEMEDLKDRQAVIAAHRAAQTGSSPWAMVLRTRALPVWNE